MNTEMRLQEIGDELERAFAADLRGEAPATRASSGRARRGSWLAVRRSRWLAAGAAAIIAVPGVAYAVGVFTSPQTVAKSLPAGALIFGSTPTCTVVQANVEYHCTLAKPPTPDPAAGLTSQQLEQLVKAPAHLGPVKVVNGIAQLTPRQEQMLQAHQNNVLSSFGFTPAQIQQHQVALNSGSAGIAAGQFKGTVEPTVDATHHVDGGCRATSADGSQWDCYIGQAAVQHNSISSPSNNPNSTGLGGYIPAPGVG
jgi:hypothetical protein